MHSGHGDQQSLAEEIAACRDGDGERRLAELRRLAVAESADRQALATLGDETRYRLGRVLAAAETSLCVCELAGVVDVSTSAVSHALGDLVDSGLATRTKEGRWRYYEATPRTNALFEALDRTAEVA